MSNNIIYDQPEEVEVGQASDEKVFTEFAEFEKYKASCEHVIAQARMAEKLASYPEFKAIVMDAYFVQEPARLGGLMGSGMLTEKQFDDCAQDLRGIGGMRKFIQDFIHKGNIAIGELEQLEAARAAAIEEQEVESNG